MVEPQSGWTDERLEQVLGNLLRSGVLLAAAVVLAGGILYLIHYGDRSISTSPVFQGNAPAPEEEPELTSFSGIGHLALQGHSRAIIQLGLLLLVATPIARVVFSAVAFVLERDRIYVLVTFFVLAVLLYSLIWGQ
jgi:uncharacterized membrane protein